MENFIFCAVEIYELDLAKFLSASRQAWQVAFKKNKVKLEFLTDIDMLLMVEESKRAGICDSIYNMQNLITNT